VLPAYRRRGLGRWGQTESLASLRRARAARSVRASYVASRFLAVSETRERRLGTTCLFRTAPGCRALPASAAPRSTATQPL